jgi:2-polyprenyl-3-methyl-5-hydroxy-6-metoxy-1,4-benzoquinol methylase
METAITTNVPSKDSVGAVAQWDPATIQRFWEYYGRRQDLHSDYFSFQVGNGIATLLADTNRIASGMSYLDYGCGPGFLVDKMLTRKMRCSGVDGSAEAVEFVNKKFQNDDNWVGAITVSEPPAPLPDASFDVVTCVETLEHLLESRLPIVVGEVYRLLKPGGVALFTTPNNEDLVHNHVYCPFCQTSFHKVQHLRSFSEDSLSALLESQGFRTLFCQGLDLYAFQQRWSFPEWKDLSIREVTNGLRKRKNALLDRIAPKPFPHGRGFRDRTTSGPHLCAVVERAAT